MYGFLAAQALDALLQNGLLMKVYLVVGNSALALLILRAGATLTGQNIGIWSILFIPFLCADSLCAGSCFPIFENARSIVERILADVLSVERIIFLHIKTRTLRRIAVHFFSAHIVQTMGILLVSFRRSAWQCIVESIICPAEPASSYRAPAEAEVLHPGATI